MTPREDALAGSARRWWALGIVALAYVLSFFQRFAPAGIAQDLAAAFQTSAASLGLLAATYFYVYTVMQVPTGVLVDTLGPRRILALGGVIAGLGSLLFGTAESLALALTGRLLVGLGVSVVFLAMLKLIALWFDESRFATLVGVGMLVGNLGSMLAGAPLSWAAQTSGWREVFVGVGLASLVLAGLCAWVVRDRPPGAPAPVPASRAAVLAALGSVLRNRATWPPMLVNTGTSGAFFIFAGLWTVPFLMQVHGLTRAQAAAHLSLWFGSFAVGSLLLGALSDRLGRRKPVMLLTTHVFAAIWLWLLTGEAMPLAASYVLFGVLGVMTAGFTLAWSSAKEVNPPQLSGMSTSLTNMGSFLAAAVLQPVVGALMDARWDGRLQDGARIYDLAAWQTGLWVVVVCALVGACSAWFVVETRCRNIWRPD